MKFDEDLAKINGYLCGDGCVSKNKNPKKHKYYRTDLRNTSLTILRDFQTRVYNYFKIKPKIYGKQRATVHSKKFIIY